MKIDDMRAEHPTVDQVHPDLLANLASEKTDLFAGVILELLKSVASTIGDKSFDISEINRESFGIGLAFGIALIQPPPSATPEVANEQV